MGGVGASLGGTAAPSPLPESKKEVRNNVLLPEIKSLLLSSLKIIASPPQLSIINDHSPQRPKTPGMAPLLPSLEKMWEPLRCNCTQ